MIDYAGAAFPPGGLSTAAGINTITADPTWSQCAIVRNRNDSTMIQNNTINTYSIGMAGIKDGSSNVLMLSEKQMNMTEEPAQDDDQGYCVGFDIDNMRSCFLPPQPDYYDNTEGNAPTNRDYIFGSSHPGILVVGMCDGSTRTVTYGIDPTVFQALCLRRDGAVVNID
jgi:hypothetical protein